MQNLFLFIVTMGVFVLPLVSVSLCEKLRKKASSNKSAPRWIGRNDFTRDF
jgi:hypothetical protein